MSTDIADRGGERGAEVKRYTAIEAYGNAYSSSVRYVLATSYDALAAERDVMKAELERRGVLMSQAADTIDRLRAMLEEVEAWLEDREDVVDGDYGEPAPNAEMRLLREVRAALSGGRT